MTYYEQTLTQMKRLLDDCKEHRYASFLADCLTDYADSKDVARFQKGFSGSGIFENFSFRDSDFDDPALAFWTVQLFGGLTAMAIQLAKFEVANRSMDIPFMRKHFGHPAEVIGGMKCRQCGKRFINAMDIAKYITPPVISAIIVDGLENGDLNSRVSELLQFRSEVLLSEQETAKRRAANTKVAVSDSWAPLSLCPDCGGNDLIKCRFLKSLRTEAFVALNR